MLRFTAGRHSFLLYIYSILLIQFAECCKSLDQSVKRWQDRFVLIGNVAYQRYTWKKDRLKAIAE